MVGKMISRYRITGKLGAGAMGEVYLADDTRLDRRAAIKILPGQLASDPDRRRRFLTEAKASSALNHPNVCVVYDVGETDDGIPFIVMEYLEGDALDSLMERGSIEITRVMEIAIQVADALDAAHARGIIHRDIKPANINCNENGTVKVLDFGIAKLTQQPVVGSENPTIVPQQTLSGQVLGTPNYMSPEQGQGQAVDHRSDIFSFGVVLYKLATGRAPFGGANFFDILMNIVQTQPPAMATLNPGVSAELERITLKCLEKSPEQRYQTARQIAEDLQNLTRALDQGGSGTAVMLAHATEPTKTDQGTQVVPGSMYELNNSDIILNYAAIDDQPFHADKPGWVSQLHRNLEVRLEQLSGEKVRVARVPSGPRSTDASFLEHLPQVKAMVSVVSPPFLKSDKCCKGVEDFWRIAQGTGGQWVEEKARLLKVVKTAISSQEMPPSVSEILSPLFGFDFYETDPQTGRIREFDESFGPALEQRFFERVYDLAHDVCQLLKGLQSKTNDDLSRGADFTQHCIYLATTTSDIQHERDRIKRELVERGHEVVPDSSLPVMSQDAEAVVQEYLQKCTIAVHLLGRHYGITPEDSSESIPALQVRLTAQQLERQDLQRLIWIPETGEIVDQRQSDFISGVQEDPMLHNRAEIIEGNLNILKKDLIRRLTPSEKKIESVIAQATTPNAAPKLYLICDPRDEGAIEHLEDYLFGQGLEVCLPAFDGSDADADDLHRENLLTCNAVLVYYGVAPKAWVDIKLRELLKAAGYGRPTPILVQAVYVAPPDDHRKGRFRSHQAQVIRQVNEFAPTPEIEEFVSAMKTAGS